MLQASSATVPMATRYHIERLAVWQCQNSIIKLVINCALKIIESQSDNLRHCRFFILCSPHLLNAARFFSQRTLHTAARRPLADYGVGIKMADAIADDPNVSILHGGGRKRAYRGILNYTCIAQFSIRYRDPFHGAPLHIRRSPLGR